jgi:hypothetical protein
VSSNYREFVNLVQTLEQGVHSGKLHHTEVWIFTDNSTLVLRLQKLEMSVMVRIHMVAAVPAHSMFFEGKFGYVQYGMLCAASY